MVPGFKRYEEIEKERRRKKTVLYAVGVLVLLSGGAAFWKIRRPPQPVPLPEVAQQVVDARGAAQYDRALQLLDQGLKSHSDAPSIRALSEELQQDLKPTILPYYPRHGALPSKSQQPGSRPRLTPEDKFYFTVNLVEVSRQCYVYMFLVDSAGDWKVLFPNKTYSPNKNPLSPALYQVPDPIGKELRPADTPGEEKVFFVVANWRIGALEDLAAALAAEVNSERSRALGQQIYKRLQLEFAKPAAIHGLKVATWESDDSGRPSVPEAEKQ
jgi:hypothetical protein